MSITGATGEKRILPLFTGDTNPSLPYLDGHGNYKFMIPVGDIPEEEIEDYIRKISKEFKKPLDITPDLDCGIYPLPDHGEDFFIPLRNNMNNNFYMQAVPDSHWYTDLNQIVSGIEYHLERLKREADPESQTRYAGEYLTKEHIVIGLNNSIKHGYRLKPTFKEEIKVTKTLIFISIEQIIEYVGGEDFTFDGFLSFLHATIENEVNMTNGLKLDRRDVYKRIDGERDYQDLRWNTNLREGDIPDEEKPVSEWLNYIEFHLLKAKNANYHLNKEQALAEIRKVAALAVRAMEIHGCPERKLPVEIGGEKDINYTNPADGRIMDADSVVVWNGETWINKITGKPVNKK